MSPKIFNLHLSDETTSLFFLIEGFADQDATVSTRQIYKVWNSSLPMFIKGLQELEERNVIRKVAVDTEYNGTFSLVEDQQWRFDN